MQLIIYRYYADKETTVGKLILTSKEYTYEEIGKSSFRLFNTILNVFSCNTIELAWKSNQKNISCIPKGLYKLELINSPKFKEVLHVLNVPNRGGILIHKGNSYKDIEGCILPVSKIEITKTVYGVSSKLAFDNIMKHSSNINSLIIIDNL
ncbi:MAG TPA: DUF5675 family protein [Burkholderiales bacterium]|nr:DUF5675 family protein [Burkholderiales bacterium]